MDPRQFDALSRRLADGVSRRQAVSRIGAAGILAGLIGALGRDRAAGARPAAQDGALDICHLQIVANIRLGPSAGVVLQGTVPGELRGELSFVIDPDGDIDDGRLVFDGGGEFPVVGQWDGRALNARVDIEPDAAVILVGTGQQRFDACTGDVDGLLTGPSVGDLGDWHATAERLGGAEGPPPTATASLPGAAPTPTSVPAAPAATAPPAAVTATPTPAATATATATPAPTETPPSPSPSPSPEPPAPEPTPDPCGPGTTNCGGICFNIQTDVNNCGACGNVCPESPPYVRGCTEGTCFFMRQRACAVGLTSCNGVCVDLLVDPANCGACGSTCGIIETCLGGACQPPQASQ